MHLRQAGLPYGACGPFTKNKEQIQKLREARDSRYIYLNELYKAYFQHGVAHRDFKDLPRRRASRQVLGDKASTIAKNPKYDRHQRGCAPILYNLLIKNCQVVLLKVKLCQTNN